MPDFDFYQDLQEKALDIILNFKSDPKHGKNAADEIESLKKNIRKTIVSLPDRYREILEMRYFDRLSLDEVSKRKNQPKEEVNKILSEAVAELKERLRKKDLEEKPLAFKETIASTPPKESSQSNFHEQPKSKNISFIFYSLIFLFIVIPAVYVFFQSSLANKLHLLFFGQSRISHKEVNHVPYSKYKYGSKHIFISGSTSLLRLSSVWMKSFRTKFPRYAVTLVSSDSDKGINELVKGKVDIANSSRPLGYSDKKKAARNGIELTEHRVALDALVIILNKRNPIEELSIEDLERIFNLEAKNWNVFENYNEPIVPVVREKGSGTNDFVLSRVVQASDFSPQTLRLNSNQEIFNFISKTPGAIGYINSGNYPWNNSDIRLVPIKNFPKSLSYSPFVRRKLNEQIVRYGDYPLSHYLYLITISEPPECVNDFIHFVLSRNGQEIVSNFGLIPVYTEEE